MSAPLLGTTLTPGAGTTFGVFFQPLSGGVRAATVQIASNDADENPFDIPVTGTATSPAAQMTNPCRWQHPHIRRGGI